MNTRAESLFRRWNNRPSDATIGHVVRDLPERMTAIGNVVECLYQSTKWSRRCTKCGHGFVPLHPGNKPCPECRGPTKAAPGAAWELYRHHFSSKPTVYARRSGTGDAYTLDLLGVDRWRADVIECGVMEELTYKPIEGGTKVMGFSSGAFLYAPNDRTLLIVKNMGGVLIIRGGKMRVTAEGIAN